jgi:hypothetical protein
LHTYTVYPIKPIFLAKSGHKAISAVPLPIDRRLLGTEYAKVYSAYWQILASTFKIIG